MSLGKVSTLSKSLLCLIALIGISLSFQNCSNVKGLSNGESGNPYEGLSGGVDSPPTDISSPPKEPGTGAGGVGGGSQASCSTQIGNVKSIMSPTASGGIFSYLVFGLDKNGKEWMDYSFSYILNGRTVGNCGTAMTSVATQNPDRSWSLNLGLAAGNETILRMDFMRDSAGIVVFARITILDSVGSVRVEEFIKPAK